MRDKKIPSGSLNASRLSSSSVSPPPFVLSTTASSQTSSLSTSFISMYTPSPMPLCSPAKPLYHNAHIIEHCTHPSSSSSPSSSSFPIRKVPFCKASSSKKQSPSCKWVSKFLKLGKLSMEAEEGFLLQQRALEGLHEESNLPKKELRFAAKIAVAMDADGFIGVKNSVCADDSLIEVKHNIDTRYCVPTPSTLQRKERPPSKQARPPPGQWRRRWKLFRRIRRTRVLFACLFQKVKKAFTSSSKGTLKAHDKFIKQ